MTMDHDPVAAQYESWVYPEPVADMVDAVVNHRYFDMGDPAFVRRKYWPKKVEPDELTMLIAGCGANQAAYYALQNPESRIVGIDISAASLAHEAYLKQKHDLRNLELRQLPLEEAASLGQKFDLIVSTGVIHHLPDPGAALRHLREVLAPHAVMSLMVYGLYPRAGVHMLQEAFRLLDVRQDAAGVALVRHTLENVLPPWHHLRSYRDPDRGFDAGLVDTFLHPRERAYTVPDILQLVSDNGLQFQGWLDGLDYAVSFRIPRPGDPLRQAIETLPLTEQWQAIELIGQALARQFFIACHLDRPASDYALDFRGQDWLDYIPSLRRPMDMFRDPPAGTSEAPGVITAVKRYSHRVECDPCESAWLMRIDGTRPIIEIIEDDELDATNAPERVQHAREFFARMAECDHLLYEIP